MKGMVSQAKTSGKRPKWIGETLWVYMCDYWATEESTSNSQNSMRGGLGAHKHLSGQKSYLRIQRELVS